MNERPVEQDGQVHTLGLIEELRAECKRMWGTSSELYFRIDELLRELANPNLHEVFLDDRLSSGTVGSTRAEPSLGGRCHRVGSDRSCPRSMAQ